MAEYVEIKHVDNLHIVINNSETRREEVEQENTRLREEIRNLKSQVRQLRQSSEGDDDPPTAHQEELQSDQCRDYKETYSTILSIFIGIVGLHIFETITYIFDDTYKVYMFVHDATTV